MAKVIKGEKQLAIIVIQKEYDLIAALVGMTNSGNLDAYDERLWETLKPLISTRNLGKDKIARVCSNPHMGIDVLNRDQEEY